MAVTGYTSDDLLTRVKARAQIPSADGRLSDADILAIADDAIQSTVSRIIWNADDGRTVRTQADVALTADVSDYRIPDRAVGSAVYDVLLVDSNGDEASMAYVDPAEAWRWRNDGATSADDSRYRFTIEGDTIRLLPTPTGTLTSSLRVKYRRRPSRLVTIAACAPLSAAPDPSPSDVSVTAIPTGWSAAEDAGGQLYLDTIRAAPGGDSLEDDVLCTTSGTTVTRVSGAWGANAYALSFVAGYADYLALAGETCVLPVPEEAVPFLTVLVALEVVTVLGDDAAAGTLQQLVAGRREELQALVHDRSREDVAIIPRSSHLRSGHRRSLRWGLG